MLGVNWGTIKRTTDWGCSRYGADRPAGTRHQGKPTGQTARARRHPGLARRSRMLEWAAGAVNSRNRGEHPGTGPRRDDIQKRNDMTTDTELLSRITVRSDVFGGKPIIRDMRIAVEHVLGMLAAGDSTETILSEYDFLEEEDIRACLLFAHRSLAGEQVYDRTPIRQAE